jgi:hypothetical protein
MTQVYDTNMAQQPKPSSTNAYVYQAAPQNQQPVRIVVPTTAPRPILKNPYGNVYYANNNQLVEYTPPTVQPVQRKIITRSNSNNYTYATNTQPPQSQYMPQVIPVQIPTQPRQYPLVSYPMYEYAYNQPHQPLPLSHSQYTFPSRRIVAQSSPFVLNNPNQNPNQDRYVVLNPTSYPYQVGYENYENPTSKFVRYGSLDRQRLKQQPAKIDSDDVIIYSAREEEEKRRKAKQKKMQHDPQQHNRQRQKTYIVADRNNSNSGIQIIDDDQEIEEDTDDDLKRTRFSAKRNNNNAENVASYRKPVRFEISAQKNESFTRAPISPLRFKSPGSHGSAQNQNRPPSRVDLSDNLNFKGEDFSSRKQKQSVDNFYQRKEIASRESENRDNHSQNRYKPDHSQHIKMRSNSLMDLPDRRETYERDRQSFESLWLSNSEGGVIPALPSATKFTKKYSPVQKKNT